MPITLVKCKFDIYTMLVMNSNFTQNIDVEYFNVLHDNYLRALISCLVDQLQRT